MRKKLSLLLLTLMIAISASAQFEQGKKYISASFSGFDLSYNGTSDLVSPSVLKVVITSFRMVSI